MRVHRLSVVLLLAALLLGGLLGPPAPAAAQGEDCFAETGQCLRARFLEYWQANGGLARNGFPLTDERRELLEDGREYTLQYFERARFERHPENASPYDVLLGQFGREILRQNDLLAGRFGLLYLTDERARDTGSSRGSRGPSAGRDAGVRAGPHVLLP